MRWLLVALGIAGCNPIEELPPDQVCKDVGYSIANRTQDCTGDLDLTRARYDLFKARYRCLVQSVESDPIDEYYVCPVKLRELSCEQVAAYGDDLDQWLYTDVVCGDFLDHQDGTAWDYSRFGANGGAGGAAGSAGMSAGGTGG